VIAYRASNIYKQQISIEHEEMTDIGLENDTEVLSPLECFAEEDDPLSYSTMILKGLCLIQMLLGFLQISRLDWVSITGFEWQTRILVLVYTIISIVGYFLSNFRIKWGVMLVKSYYR